MSQAKVLTARLWIFGILNTLKLKHIMSNLVTCIGDSLTQFGIRNKGWISLLNSYYERQLQFLCFGYSGYNTKWIFEHLKTILPFRTNYYIIWLGTNDCCTDTIQHVSKEEYRSNMKAIINHISLYSPGTKIFVISPIPTVRPERQDARQYFESLSDLPKDIIYVNLFDYEWNDEDYCDQLHLSDKGNYKISEILKKVLGARIQIDRKLPDWKELN